MPKTFLKNPTPENPDKPAPRVASHLPLKVDRVLNAELNLAKFGAFIFSPSHTKSDTARVKTWVFDDPETGNKTRSKILVEPVQSETLNTFDHRIVLALQKLWWEKPHELDGTVSFTLQELARAIGKKWGGKLRPLLKASLRRLRKVPVTWHFAFYDKSLDRLRSFEEPMNLLATLRIYEMAAERALDRPSTKSVFRFNENIERNLLNRSTKPIIFDVMTKIRGEIALSLYSFLDLVMASKTRWERRAAELLREDLSCGGSYQWAAERARILRRVIKELDGKPISTGELNLSLEKTIDGKDYKLIVVKTALRRRIHRPALNPQQEDLVTRILEVAQDPHSRSYYEKLVRLCPRTLLEQAISATKDASLTHSIQSGSRGRYFTGTVKQLAQEQGIALDDEPATSGPERSDTVPPPSFIGATQSDPESTPSVHERPPLAADEISRT